MLASLLEHIARVTPFKAHVNKVLREGGTTARCQAQGKTLILFRLVSRGHARQLLAALPRSFGNGWELVVNFLLAQEQVCFQDQGLA